MTTPDLSEREQERAAIVDHLRVRAKQQQIEIGQAKTEAERQYAKGFYHALALYAYEVEAKEHLAADAIERGEVGR